MPARIKGQPPVTVHVWFTKGQLDRVDELDRYAEHKGVPRSTALKMLALERLAQPEIKEITNV